MPYSCGAPACAQLLLRHATSPPYIPMRLPFDAPLYSRGGCVRSSGYITYDELHEVVRRKMHVKPKTMSDHDLRGLWCALDVDQSNTLLMDEFGKFLKLGAVSAKLKKQPSVKREPTNAAILEKREARNGALESPPTKKIRAELEAAGVALPDDAQLLALSKDFNRCAADHACAVRRGPAVRTPAPHAAVPAPQAVGSTPPGCAVLADGLRSCGTAYACPSRTHSSISSRR